MKKQSQTNTAPIYLLFFLSGATGLIYEILWISRFGRLFGNSSYAIGTVLAAYMGGLALGSYILGNKSDRYTNPLRVYAVLEILIALTAFLVPVFLWICKPVYIAVSATHNPLVINLTRLFVSLLVLLPPTVCMGGTLPVLVKYCTRENTDAGHRLGVLYSFNTFGAVIGTALAGFYLLPVWGERYTLLVGVFFNVSICITAWILSKQPFDGTSPVKDSFADKKSSAAYSAGKQLSPVMVIVLLVTLGMAGFAAMGFEMVWSRLTALILGSSVYAFTAMLVVFLIGLAWGSALAGTLLNRHRPSVLWFTAAEAGIAIWVIATLRYYDNFTTFIGVFNQAAQGHFNLILSAIFFVCLFMMLIPAMFMGSVIPVVMAIVNKGKRAGHYTGTVYATNTAGGILGSIISGFALVPLLGIQSTLILCLLINLVAAALSLLAYRRTFFFVPSLLILALLAAMACRVPPWDPVKMSSGAFLYGPQDNINAELLYSRDGVSCTVSVEEYPDGSRTLRVNGKADASTDIDMSNQIMTGLLAMLYKPDAENVLVIGYGSGVSVGAVLHYDVKTVHCAELEKRVMEADPYFNVVNHSPLSDPRLQIFVEDGRNIIETAKTKYDVIVSEPSNPWMAGIADLFTRDYYLKCREGLTAEGVMCQWLQAYNTSVADFKTISKTFASVFPHHAMYKVSSGDFLLLGSDRPLIPDLMAIQKDIMSKPVLARDLLQFCGTEDIRALLTRYFVIDDEDFDRFCEDAPRILSDAHNTLAYTAVQNLFAGEETDTDRIFEALYREKRFLLPQGSELKFTGRDHALSASLLNIGDSCLKSKNLNIAGLAYHLALQADPGNIWASAGMLKVLLLTSKPADQYNQYLQAVMTGPPDIAHETCRWLFSVEQISLAQNILGSLVERYPASPTLKARLAAALANTGHEQQALELLKAAQTADPLNEDVSGLLMIMEARTP